ncbi:MAG: FHA domain-containing protein [Synechococcus sp.]
MNTLLSKTASPPTNTGLAPILIVHDRRGRHGMVLDEDSYTIGRSSSCSIRLADPCVSRIHARLNRVKFGDKSRFQILDGKTDAQPSTNGVLLDDQPIKNRMLKSGDTLWLSDQTYIMFTSREELSPEELATLELGAESNAQRSSNDLSEEITAAKSLNRP